MIGILIAGLATQTAIISGLGFLLWRDLKGRP